MFLVKQYSARLFLLAGVTMIAAACTAEHSAPAEAAPAANEPAIKTPAYVSNMRVTTNCGVAGFPPPPPGFAATVGSEQKEMTERIATNLAVGAERPLAETDLTRMSPGYLLVDPGAIAEAHLIDNEKQVAATFKGDYPSQLTQLLPNGNRLVSSQGRSDTFAKGGGYRGCIEEYEGDGTLVWRLSLNDERYVHHHDVVKLPNGNILAVVWENVSKDDAISQGRDPERVAANGNFWYDGIVEVDPYRADIVWEWSIRHHLVQDFAAGKVNYGVVAEHPELLDINAIKPNMDGSVSDDWTHVNAIDYNAELDQIAISSNYMSEIWIIDHSTTPQESAGHSGGRSGRGGDFLYRWGNPQRYDRGTAAVRTLFNQHDVQWIREGLPGAGNLLIFNNGDSKERPYSTVVELVAPMSADGAYQLQAGKTFGPTTLAWEYNPEPPERFFSFFISGAQRLPNGNTLVDQGAGGKVREVTSAGEIVWEYKYENEVDAPHMLFRANRYPPDHPGIVELLRHAK
jgi:hypothetical protein